MGKEIGVTRQAIAWWEAGLRYPRDEHLIAYAALLRFLQEELATQEVPDA